MVIYSHTQSIITYKRTLMGYMQIGQCVFIIISITPVMSIYIPHAFNDINGQSFQSFSGQGP